MSLRDFTLTLTGVAQQLSTALPVDTTRGGVRDEAYRELVLQADPNNGNAVYIGSSSAVSSSSHGFSLDPTQASAPPLSLGPFDAGPIKLSDFWVTGTNGEKVHVLGVPF